MLFASAYAQDIKVEINAPDTVAANRPFSVTYNVISQTFFIDLKVSFMDIDVLAGPTTSTSRSMSMSNGRNTYTYKYAYTYILSCKNEGLNTIESASIQLESSTVATDPIRIYVLNDNDTLYQDENNKVTIPQKQDDLEMSAILDANNYLWSSDYLYDKKVSNPARFKMQLGSNMLLACGCVTHIVEESEMEFNPLLNSTMEKKYYDVVLDTNIVIRVELDSEVARIEKGEEVFALVTNLDKTKYREELPIFIPVITQIKSTTLNQNRYCFFESVSDVQKFMKFVRSGGIHSTYIAVDQRDKFYFQNLLVHTK